MRPNYLRNFRKPETERLGFLIPMETAKFIRRFPSVVLLCLALASSASASYISLNTSLSSKFEHGKVKANVSIINKGDEAACNVQAEFRSGGVSVLADKVPQLPVGWTYKTTREIPLKLTTPGSYPLALVVHYTDANSYPFSSLTLQTFVFGREAPAPVFGQLGSATFDKGGRLTLKLKNSGARPVTATAALIVPAELTVDGASQPVAIGARSEQTVSFTVKNFSALAGSTYQVFAVTEFDDGGLHFTAIAPGLVKISAGQKFLGLDSWVYFAGLAVLVLVFALAQFLRKK